MAAFQRQDKLPSLESLLAKRQTTTTDPKHMLQQLSERFGLPMRQARLIRKDAA